MSFYESLASDYDLMTRFDSRVESEKTVLAELIGKFGVKSVLDIACGSGLHSIALAQLGVDVIGVDVSKTMIDLARQNAKRLRLTVPFVEGSMQSPGVPRDRTFDAVFCLGNSLPHLLTNKDISTALNSFGRFLEREGLLILQLLNYDKILADKQRIFGVHKNGDKTFVRFYDFLPDLVQFNILTISEDGDGIGHKLDSTLLYPYRADELTASLAEAGFNDIDNYSNLKLEPFDVTDSRDLVMVARK